MTSTHGRKNSPPGIHAPPRRADRDAPRRHHAPPELLAGRGVDDGDAGVEDHALAEHSPLPHARPLGHHAPAPDVGVVTHHDRGRVGGLEDSADPHPAGQVHTRPDLGARPDGGPRVDHGVGPDAGPDVDVARHEDDATVEERPPPRRRAGDDAHPRRRVTRSSGGACRANSKGPTSMRVHGPEPEEQEDGGLEPGVDHDRGHRRRSPPHGPRRGRGGRWPRSRCARRRCRPGLSSATRAHSSSIWAGRSAIARGYRATPPPPAGGAPPHRPPRRSGRGGPTPPGASPPARCGRRAGPRRYARTPPPASP